VWQMEPMSSEAPQEPVPSASAGGPPASTPPPSAGERDSPEERLARLEHAIPAALCASSALVSQAVGYVPKVRSALSATPANVTDAEHYLLLGEALVSRATHSDDCRRRVALIVWVYSAAWLALAAWGWLSLDQLVTDGFSRTLIICGLSGIVGGITQALYGLRVHVARRGFDEALLNWYYSKPITGMILGPIAHAVLTAMFGEATPLQAMPAPIGRRLWLSRSASWLATANGSASSWWIRCSP
jgi:hypothetical protein